MTIPRPNVLVGLHICHQNGRNFGLIIAIIEDGSPTKKSKNVRNRLRRCAQHFLLAGEQDRVDVMAESLSDTTMHYVIALETILASDGRDELSYKVSHRAAVLAGSSDEEQVKYFRIVRSAYGARSRYVHGDEENIPQQNMEVLRIIVRRCVVAWLTIGSSAAVDRADSAILSPGERERIRNDLGEIMGVMH